MNIYIFIYLYIHFQFYKPVCGNGRFPTCECVRKRSFWKSKYDFNGRISLNSIAYC